MLAGLPPQISTKEGRYKTVTSFADVEVLSGSGKTTAPAMMLSTSTTVSDLLSCALLFA
jgi:hypothetical protein